MSKPFRACSAWTHLRSGIVGGIVAGAVILAGSAVAGSGVGGLFNLGQSNTVNGTSALSGSTAGKQLVVANVGTATTSSALLGYARGASAAATFQNAGSGPALSLLAGAGQPPFTTNSGYRVTNLNADKLDGRDSTTFLQKLTDADGQPCTTDGKQGSISATTTSGELYYGSGAEPMKLACLYEDQWEQDDTRATEATPTQDSPGCPYPVGCRWFASIYPAGDDDWYSFPGVKLHAIYRLTSGLVANSVGLSTIDVYRDTVLVATNADYYQPPSDDTATHVYEVRVHDPGVAHYALDVIGALP
jgi:hypothetical protein